MVQIGSDTVWEAADGPELIQIEGMVAKSFVNDPELTWHISGQFGSSEPFVAACGPRP